MSTSVKLEKPEKPERPERSEKKSNFSQEKMLSSLWKMKSEPLNAVKIDVKHLYENRYRVNVWCGEALCNAVKITNSYFLLVKSTVEVSSIRPD